MFEFPKHSFQEDDTIIGLMADILNAHKECVVDYKSDLIHDGVFLQEHVFNGKQLDTFYFGIRPTGTSIGSEMQYVEYLNEIVYRIDVTRREEGYVCGRAIQLKEPKEKEDARV